MIYKFLNVDWSITKDSSRWLGDFKNFSTLIGFLPTYSSEVFGFCFHFAPSFSQQRDAYAKEFLKWRLGRKKDGVVFWRCLVRYNGKKGCEIILPAVNGRRSLELSKAFRNNSRCSPTFSNLHNIFTKAMLDLPKGHSWSSSRPIFSSTT